MSDIASLRQRVAELEAENRDLRATAATPICDTIMSKEEDELGEHWKNVPRDIIVAQFLMTNFLDEPVFFEVKRALGRVEEHRALGKVPQFYWYNYPQFDEQHSSSERALAQWIHAELLKAGIFRR